MKKNIGLVIALLFLTSATLKTTTQVFICKGKGSKRYHFSSNCRGLSNCSTRAYKVTLQDARSIGRTLCGWED